MNYKKHVFKLTAIALCTTAFGSTALAANLTTLTPDEDISIPNIRVVRPRSINEVYSSTLTNPNIQQNARASVGAMLDNYQMSGQDLQKARTYAFTDVPSNYWAHDSIVTMTEQKYISGYSDGTFRPDQAMTREEVATLFNNIIGKASPIMLSSSFSDITSDRWSANAIETVARLNIVSGYGDKTYHPDEKMSRQQFAVVADNYLHYLGYKTADPTDLDKIAFSDQKFVAAWAQDSVRELASLGFLQYNPRTLFNPEKYITRAEATELVYRMTNTKEALALRNQILRQRIEEKTDTILKNALGSLNNFDEQGLTYWENNLYKVSLKDKKTFEKVNNEFAEHADLELKEYVQLSTSRYVQNDFDTLYQSASTVYKTAEKKGHILDVTPNTADGSIALTVDTITVNAQKAISQKFGQKVILVSPATDPLANK